MVLVIDNYDSFTYNLVQYIGSLGKKVLVRRNDEIDLEEIARINPDQIVISPGPGYPMEAGKSLDIIKNFFKKIPILGVCLGHQCIAEAMNGKVVPADTLMHGKSSTVHHDGKGLFGDVQNPFPAGRYHSLVVEKRSLPDCLEISATTDDGTIMGIRHKNYPVEGVQFHPESILTGEGMRIIENFLEEKGGRRPGKIALF
ncbi:MAG: aminodeoxychorismate/anthranilate synthase component II [Calditrichaeota bacterium]|nr:aminodeoxychorismate/anthranilate synthase component II [Calditrichota bacterium]